MDKNFNRFGLIACGLILGVGLALTGTLAQRTSLDGKQLEPKAGSWKTWILESGSQLRLPAPKRGSDSSELIALKKLFESRDAKALERILYWDAGAPAYRWMQIAFGAGITKPLASALLQYRMTSLLSLAVYDATIAAWDSKYSFNRARPNALDRTLETAIETPHSPSYPDERAVVAGAASALLSYIFPEKTAEYTSLAEEAARSRLMAGVSYPSDVSAGLALGRQVAVKVIEWAKKDGSDVKFTGTVPTGPGKFIPAQGTSGVEPLGGTWKTLALSSGNQFRPAPPPAFGTPEFSKELAEVKDFKQHANPARAALFWGNDPNGRPVPGSQPPVATDSAVLYYAPLNNLIYGAEADQKIFEYGLVANPPKAARAYLLVAQAGYEAGIACWDAKYTYWQARPAHVDSSIATVLPTYNHPSYPSGHSCIEGAAAAAESYLWPSDANYFNSRAVEMSESRIWAGIHFRSDVKAGLELGRMVASAVIERAKADGSDAK